MIHIWTRNIRCLIVITVVRRNVNTIYRLTKSKPRRRRGSTFYVHENAIHFLSFSPIFFLFYKIIKKIYHFLQLTIFTRNICVLLAYIQTQFLPFVDFYLFIYFNFLVECRLLFTYVTSSTEVEVVLYIKQNFKHSFCQYYTYLHLNSNEISPLIQTIWSK